VALTAIPPHPTAIPTGVPTGVPAGVPTGVPTGSPPTLQREQQIVELWCELTGTDHTSFGEQEEEAFLARPQMPALCALPDDTLRAAATAARRGHSLPLERWLAAARDVRRR
jgi:hypothetical protein